MTAISERYDRNAILYEQYWAPVLAAAAARLLDRTSDWALAARRSTGRLRVVDLGTGTGALAIDAVGRWPGAHVTGVDVAAGMLTVAERRATRDLEPGARERIAWLEADAAQIDMPDASVDLIVSSFVLQLVADRAATFRELLRLLRPGGRLAFVTWSAGRDAFSPAEEFDEAVYDVVPDEAEYEDEARAGDFRSARAAAGELRAAGFRRVSAEIDRLDHAWTRESYLAYKLGYDEISLLSDLDESTARRLEDRARDRLARLPDDAFRWRPPVVYARGDRADDLRRR